MKVALASDHRGIKIKKQLFDFLQAQGHTPVDFGPFTEDACDYPDFIYPASVAVREKKVDRAIVICYTGIGSAIAANKVRGIRAALVYNLKSATLTRQHNDTNVLVLPSFLMKMDYIKKVVKVWLKTEFEAGRHLRRVQKIREIEEKERKIC